MKYTPRPVNPESWFRFRGVAFIRPSERQTPVLSPSDWISELRANGWRGFFRTTTNQGT